MKTRAILFDLDGTLRDTRDIIYEGYRHAVSQHSGFVPTDEEMYEHRNHHSHIHAAFAADVDPKDFEKTYFSKISTTILSAKLYQQASKVLADLRSRSLLLAVVSSAPPKGINTYLKNSDIAQYFDVIVGDDGKIPRKPAPDPLVSAARQLGVDISDCVMIGDMLVDVEAGRAAGVKAVIGITHGFEDRKALLKAGADYVVDSLSEITDIIEQI